MPHILVMQDLHYQHKSPKPLLKCINPHTLSGNPTMIFLLYKNRLSCTVYNSAVHRTISNIQNIAIRAKRNFNQIWVTSKSCMLNIRSLHQVSTVTSFTPESKKVYRCTDASFFFFFKSLPQWQQFTVLSCKQTDSRTKKNKENNKRKSFSLHPVGSRLNFHHVCYISSSSLVYQGNI